MPKLYSAREIIKTLNRAGFTIVSQRGSHIKLFKRERDKSFTAIVPNHKQVAIGTFNSILKQAGMTREEFEKWIR
ncbi:type II toxin-antitoxin system HicA family toxin [Candidatus Microgenomates bacterium]|nr:type II toxin-antitoxin system HicA family toxin [Candidatus Microgenomates bacterium]